MPIAIAIKKADGGGENPTIIINQLLDDGLFVHPA
jgi:hypothetical protein